ncbi:TetR family transcriptional regulator [Rhizobium metallidurans]|uniref:AcrR family transcriptional regulator n=1 Tax=Rhizobium metallidurans TaxID=1265931 RepID=A0A7W6CSN3_9HYPH|nr:TetR family transcriptional regulator [Rhizobium metallidurans]MBB3962945.1 AcrR family transcriptional regulator [Rhizobium metallidurans]
MHGRANLTAIRLMDACEHLLCESETVDDLTARRIAIEAHATPSAIVYHFGSQEALISAVAERVYRRLNAERLSLLRKAVDRRAPEPADLAEIIAALVGPSIRWSLDPSSSYAVLSHFTSMVKTHREEAPHHRRITGNVEHHRAFIPHLKRIAPWLDDVEIGWRLNCALGIRSQVTRSRSRTELLTNFSMNLDDPELVIARMTEVIAPMFRKPI